MKVVCLYLSAQVYTMNSSSYLQQSNHPFSDSGINPQKMHQFNLSSQHPSLNLFAILQDGMLLIAKKIEAFQFKNIVTACILRSNGSAFMVPFQYAGLLTQTIQCNDMIQFSVHRHDDYFTIVLRISLVLTDQRTDLNQIQQKLISSWLQKYRRFLIFVGQIKDKSVNSFKFHKNILRLKANIVKSLKTNNLQTNSNKDDLEIFMEDNGPIIVSQIKEDNSMKKEDQDFLKKGGYFCVQKKMCEVLKCDGTSFKQPLAIKKIRYQKNTDKQGEEKMKHQLELIKKIRNKKYLVNYYKPLGQSCFAMDFVEKNLKEIKYSYEILNIRQIFSICKQLIEAVLFLHESKIVHRDLKLENILVDIKNQIKIKLIDFGESATTDSVYIENHKLGCSIPYSPIECMINCPQGYNKEAIDLWSVVIIIYQLIFKQMPVYYNRKIQNELINGWKFQQEFTTILSHRPKRGVRKIQEYANLLAEAGLKIDQKQRLKLPALLSYIKSLQIFYNDLVDYFMNGK